MADLSELNLPVRNPSTGEVVVQNFKLTDYYGGGGSGSGDMTKAVYDSDNSVETAGGIKAFVNSLIAGKADRSSLATVATSGSYNDLSDRPTIPSVTGKADKVSGATNGNFAALDSNGNLTDSGHKHSDYLTSHQSLAAYYQTGDTAETALADGDYFPFYDTSASGKRKTLWSNIKSVLKTYFDTLYKGASAHDAWGDVTSKPFNTVGSGLTVTSNALTANVQSVAINNTGTASATGAKFQRVGVNGSYTEIQGTKYLEATSYTTSGSERYFDFTHSAITSSAVFDVYCDVPLVSPTQMVQSGTNMKIYFNASDSVTKCRLYIKA